MLNRAVGFVTALLLLHLTLVGGSIACVTNARGADAAVSDHSGMSMHGSIHSATLEDSGCPGHHTTSPCDSMTACAPVVLGAPVVGMSIVDAPAAHAISSRVLVPPTRTTAPELPPPRS